MTRARYALAAGLLLLLAPASAEDKPAAPAAAPAPAPAGPAIENGATVQLEYTLKDDAGTVLDSTKGRDPLRSIHGERQIIPTLEKEAR